MARSLWTGSLSFGLVNVPVALITAARDLDLHFTQIHEKDGAPIEIHRYCSEEDVEVPYEEITHGYDCEDGQQVIVTDLELEAVEPRETRTIDIEQFVDLDDVDPIYFDHPYFLVPASDDDGATRAYRLLSEVMSQTERAALGRFVMRAKEYLAIVRARDGVLTLTTMLFADEVRPTQGRRRGDPEVAQALAQATERGGSGDRGALERVGARALQGRIPRSACRRSSTASARARRSSVRRARSRPHRRRT